MVFLNLYTLVKSLILIVESIIEILENLSS
jgi:hypothetical protein